MKAKFTFSVFLLLMSVTASKSLPAQPISIPRIDLMPDFPQPYLMRDWKRVAQQYDSLVFDITLQGQYLPLVFYREQSINYPGYQSFGLHTSVGTMFPTSGEAINVIPAIVGATLCGIDKSDQFDQNWALMCQEFFNRRPAENIYLNHPATSSGINWWYETMPNIFFMQLRYLYPEFEVFDEQLISVASQWRTALKHMGASTTPWTIPEMNYRAWNMSTMSPLAAGVRQPEAAGAIAWIMYQTYRITGNAEYRIAAELALEYLNSLNSNPSYELQLPYGVYTAARMNAEYGTSFDIEKMVNWIFDRGHLRGWGTIVGNWGGYDVSGLVGEANDQGNDYAFMMNGYQHAAALVPMLRYDKRFAKAIAKWVLNLANASRLFYPKYLPPGFQDNYAWSEMYDPNSAIGYEAMKEVKHGKSPYATGDAIEGNWSQTNLMLYSSSHVGYMAALIDTTNVEGILKIDLLVTDFYHAPAFPSWLFYNPHDEAKEVHFFLPTGLHDIYDAMISTVIAENQSGMYIINIDPKSTVMAVVIPAGSTIIQDGKKSFVGDIVIDYDNGAFISNYPPRIKALSPASSLIETHTLATVYCTATDPDEYPLIYEWWLNGEPIVGTQILYFTPIEPGDYVVSSRVTDAEGLYDSTSVIIQVVDKIPFAPVIHSIKALPRKCEPSQQIVLTCEASDLNSDTLTYEWFDYQGRKIGNSNEIIYIAPSQPGNYYVFCTVTDTDGLFSTDSLEIMVREFSQAPGGSLIARYRLDGNARDAGVNQLDGITGGGITWGFDASGKPGGAACLEGSSAHILLPHSPLFNSTQAMSLTFVMKINSFYDREQYVVSHGSWQNRFKVSLSTKKIRFTVNTTNGVFDLDSEIIPETGQWYHVAVVFDGQDAELWINGYLDNFTMHSGSIRQTTIQPVIGLHLPANNEYRFSGCIFNVSFYDYALSPKEIMQDMESGTPDVNNNQRPSDLLVFPNPLKGEKLFFKTDWINGSDMTFTIVNIYGEVVQKGRPQQIGDGQYYISIDKYLSNGVYVLCLRDQNFQKKGVFMLLLQ